MKRIAAVLILASVTFAQTCPQQAYVDPATCPAQIDVNDLTIDPADGIRRYLGYVQAELGKPWVWEGYACTEEPNRAPAIAASTGTLTQTADPNNGHTLYTLRGTVERVGVTLVRISAIVPPAEGEVSIERAGSIAVLGMPRVVPAPTLCGGRP